MQLRGRTHPFRVRKVSCRGGRGECSGVCSARVRARVIEPAQFKRERSMMKRLMRSGVAIVTGILLVAFPITGAASAKPDKPEHAAQTSDGKGCLVRDGAGAYHFDAAC